MTSAELSAALRDQLTPIVEQLDALITDSRKALAASQGSEAASKHAAALAAQLVETVAELAGRLAALELAHKERTNGDGNRCRLSEIPL